MTLNLISKPLALVLVPLQPALQVSTRPSLQTPAAPSVLRTATRSETGPPCATATLDSSGPMPTLPPWPALVRTRTHTRASAVRTFSASPANSGGNISPCHCAPSAASTRLTNLGEWQLCSMIQLLMTKPPSSSCLATTTEDIDGRINVPLSWGLPRPLPRQTPRLRSVCHKLNYVYIQHMGSLAWEKKKTDKHR